MVYAVVLVQSLIFRLILLNLVLDFGIGVLAINFNVKISNIVKHDEKFPEKFSQENKKEILRLHNEYRSKVNPPASNMRFMTWDSEAEDAAQLWAKSCSLTRVIPPGYEEMGYNVYIGQDNTALEVLRFWWKTNEDYNFFTSQCKPHIEDACRSSTQIVWATSNRVGCAVHSCSLVWNVTVCFYRPFGDYQKEQPYEMGDPCSQCDADSGGWCYENLCVKKEDCKALGLECTCSLKCRNCGVLDEENCLCTCKEGWDSRDCSKPCENSNSSYCAQLSGSSSNDSCLEDEIRKKHCRASCNECNPTPDGVSCPDGYAFNEDKCECAAIELIKNVSGQGTDDIDGSTATRLDDSRLGQIVFIILLSCGLF